MSDTFSLDELTRDVANLERAREGLARHTICGPARVTIGNDITILLDGSQRVVIEELPIALDELPIEEWEDEPEIEPVESCDARWGFARGQIVSANSKWDRFSELNGVVVNFTDAEVIVRHCGGSGDFIDRGWAPHFLSAIA